MDRPGRLAVRNMNNREALILLNMTEGVGPKKIQGLLTKLDKLTDIFNISLERLAAIIEGKLARKIITLRQSREFTQELKNIDKEKIDILTILDSDYPKLLQEIYDPPQVLYLKGKRSILNKACLGVVGSRKASTYGLNSSRKFSFSLGRVGFVVASGLARGIDTYAHKGALEAGAETVAVLGSGLLNIYPRENKSLAQEIAASGCLVSEFPLNTTPFRENFPRRNRIISGLSKGVLVVEAAQKSGALITANFALDQGREVFCLPGNVDSDQSKGTNLLIKEGAKLVDSVEDILTELGVEYEKIISYS